MIRHQTPRPDLPTNFQPNPNSLRPSILTLSIPCLQIHAYLQKQLQSGGYDVISKIFYKRYEIQTKNIAESDHQRNFCKKPQLKIFCRSGGVVKWAEHTNKQTDIEILLIYSEYIVNRDI